MSHIIQNPQYKSDVSEHPAQDLIMYSDKDHKTWQYLYNTQTYNLQDIAHSNMLEYLKELSLPEDHIPQLGEISKVLHKKTGWQVCRAVDLLDGDAFFQLLADRKFPSTIYIRDNEEVLLSKDPDIFHEIFGHCPILLDGVFASLFEKIGLLGLQFDEIQRGFLQRMFWFTFETGLFDSSHGLKVYGGSLLSSIRESRYAVKSVEPIKRAFEMINIFRTSYRADLLQPIYYVISNFSELHTMLDNVDQIKKNMELAYNLGEFFPLFPVEQEYSKYINYNICKFVHEQPLNQSQVA
jgi:phenylalanine-4-hydroxylase